MEQQATHDGLLTTVTHIMHRVFDVHRSPLLELSQCLLRFDASCGLFHLFLFLLLNPLSPTGDSNDNYSPDLDPNDNEESNIILLAVALLITGTCLYYLGR